jgi:hypothetical protein
MPDDPTPETPVEENSTAEPDPDADIGGSSDSEPDTFPRSYVEELREESKSWRLKAQRADDLAHRLHTELVKATGRLADPTDIPFDETHLDKPEALASAVDELLQRKPHLASRRPSGDVGQGATPSRPNVDLAAILRNAR